MRTISYLIKQDNDGSIKVATVSRGALCYTGRILLEQYNDNESIEKLINFGPMDILGFFEEDAVGEINPNIITLSLHEQTNRLPYQFRSGTATFDTLDTFISSVKGHTHFGVVNYFLHKNDQWYYAKHNARDFIPLTTTVVYYDDEDNG